MMLGVCVYPDGPGTMFVLQPCFEPHYSGMYTYSGMCTCLVTLYGTHSSW